MTGTRRRTWAVLLLSCAPAFVTSPARADSGAPASFDLTTTAVGISVQSTQRPASSIITAGLIDATVAFSSSSLSSYGTSETRAAAVYPGDLVAGGPALLCANVFPCPVTPPDYPLLADAIYPTRPSASAAPAAAPVGAADARAALLSTSGAASTGERTEVAVRVATAAVSTRLWADGAGAHALSRSLVTDLSVGPLRVAVLEAEDAVHVSAAGVVSDRPRLALSGVTFAGQDATVDDRGVHLAGQDVDVPNQSLAAQGISARLLSTNRQDAKGVARSAAAGLLLTFSLPVSGLPQVPNAPSLNRAYLGSVLVGGAGAVVAAADLPAFEVPVLPPAPPGSATTAVLPGTGPGPGSLSLGQGGPTHGPAVAAPQTAPAGRPLASWLPLPDLRTVALLLMVIPLALLISWRGAARLSRRTR